MPDLTSTVLQNYSEKSYFSSTDMDEITDRFQNDVDDVRTFVDEIGVSGTTREQTAMNV